MNQSNNNLWMFLTIILLMFLVTAGNAVDETWQLEEGFNFRAHQLTLTTPITSADLLDAHSEISNIFRFDATTQEFAFQLRLVTGTYFGTPFAIEPGQGYVVKSSAAISHTFSGDTSVVNPLSSLKEGFNFIGMSAKANTSAQTWLESSNDYLSVFRWDAPQAGFAFLLKLATGAIFGQDFMFAATDGYFIKYFDSSKALASIALDQNTVTVKTNVVFDLTTLTITGTWNDTTTKPITTGFVWSQIAGVGSLVGTNWTAPATAGSATLQVSYTENSVTKTADLTITIDGDKATVSFLTGTGGTFTTTLDNFASTEEAVVIVYAKNNVNSDYSYSISGFLAGSTAPPLTPTRFMAPGLPLAQSREDLFFQELRKWDQLVAEKRATLPPINIQAAPSRATDVAHTVGETISFWYYLDNQNVQLTARCKAIGNNCYVFQDTEVENGTLTFTGGEAYAIPEGSWAAIVDAFDNSIYPNVTGTFGAEPRPPADVDGDDRVYILYTPNVNRAGAGGFFYSVHEEKDSDSSTWWNIRSNEKEMFFMSQPSQDVSQQFFLDHFIKGTKGTIAHEFQHMINYNQHVRLRSGGFEEAWIDEGLAQCAEDVAGYGYNTGGLSFTMEPFLADMTLFSLPNWFFNNGSYGMSYLFIRYLMDQGVSANTLLATTLTGKANVENATGLSFAEVFKNWGVALYLSNLDKTSNAKYGYTSINLRSAQVDGTTLNGPVPKLSQSTFPFNQGGSVKSWGMNFIKVTGGTGAAMTLTVTDTGGTADLGVTVIRIQP